MRVRMVLIGKPSRLNNFGARYILGLTRISHPVMGVSYHKHNAAKAPPAFRGACMITMMQRKTVCLSEI